MILNLCTFFILLSTAFGYPSASNDQRCLNYCSDGGICVIEDGTPRCDCLPLWEGERCTEVRPVNRHVASEMSRMSQMSPRNTKCSLLPVNPCQNGGLCTYDSKNKEYGCDCVFPWTGNACEDESPCKGYCKNKGVCTDSLDKTTNITSLSCECTGTGYGGPTCNLLIPTTTTSTEKPTTNSVCIGYDKFCNGAPCKAVNGAPTCDCPSNTVGPFCKPSAVVTQTPTTSSSAAPPNPQGQTTTTAPPNPQAQTTTTAPPNPQGQTTTTGSPVQPATPPPGIKCDSKTCKNGGTCFNTGNTYFCYCGTRYTGYDCSTPK